MTDPLVKTLEKVTGLRVLKLGGTKVTDQGIRDLSKFKALEEIELDGSESITDDALVALGQMSKLTAVSLENCGDAVRRFYPFRRLALSGIGPKFCVRATLVLQTTFESGPL